MKNSLRRIARKISNKILPTNITTFITHIPEITPLNPRESNFSGKRINLLVPSIRREHIFGGISTALNFFDSLAGDKFKLRIILTDASPDLTDLANFPKYSYIPVDKESEESFQIVALNDRYKKTLPVSKDDIFMATAWWTAYFAQRIVRWQAETYGQELKKMIYFIQDYEPGFYQWSSQYALAESTYKFEGPQIAIFNTYLLQEFFQLNGYKFYKQISFEPKMNLALKNYLDNAKSMMKKRKILIYGRPHTARNAFTLIIEALRIWATTYPRAAQWEILSAGEQHPDIDLGNGISVKSKGKMTLEEYAETLNESAIGISLMVSPHPSYPPLEMAHFGMLVLTNNYANKNLSKWHSNITSLDNYAPDRIADSLNNICNNFEIDQLIGPKGKSYIPTYLDDSEQFSFIEDLINLL